MANTFSWIKFYFIINCVGAEYIWQFCIQDFNLDFDLLNLRLVDADFIRPTQKNSFQFLNLNYEVFKETKIKELYFLYWNEYGCCIILFVWWMLNVKKKTSCESSREHGKLFGILDLFLLCLPNSGRTYSFEHTHTHLIFRSIHVQWLICIIMLTSSLSWSSFLVKR